jgi:hypothetical protein
MMSREKFRKLTPMCIAGNKGHLDAASILLKFFNKYKEVLKEIFEDYYQPPEPVDDESKKAQKFEIRVFMK